IQTVKTQELNLFREQNMVLNVELQQRRSEQESLLAQKDDLSSQLQVFIKPPHYKAQQPQCSSLGPDLAYVFCTTSQG
ncbi:GRIP1-associated protein 1 isoform X1, partial [Tachysurus ichikawai]